MATTEDDWDTDEQNGTRETAGMRVLGPDGILAGRLSNYEPRQAQIEMAELVERAIRERRHAMIEAGTGTGKSFAYLIPAIMSGNVVVVSTDTIQLQEQLANKDLPFLCDVLSPLMERPIRYAIAKGRGNYLCIRNAAGIADEGTLFKGHETRTGEDSLLAQDAAACLESFRDGKWDGDKAHLLLPISDARWSPLAGEDSCTGRSCEHADTCPYLAAKAKVEQADIVVTNHTMYMLDQKVRQRTRGIKGILPDHRFWIADEAHTLSDKAVDQFGAEVTDQTPLRLVRKLKRQIKRLRLSIREDELDLDGIESASDSFFKVFHGAAKQEQTLAEFPPEILDLARTRMETLTARIKPIRTALHWATTEIDRLDTERINAVDRLRQNVDDLIYTLEKVMDPEPDPDWVRYAEIEGRENTKRDVTLCVKPIETHWIFRGILNGWGGDEETDPLEDEPVACGLDSAIFTSATLATGTGATAFKHSAREFGLKAADVLTLQAESPFDYARQVVGYLPKRLPDQRSPDYHTELAEEIVNILDHTQGRAFVLFTSFRDMKRVKELVERMVRFVVMMQGDCPKDLLIEDFKATPNAVLFGVKTFWTGVDIQGDALSCVVITKLPFPVFGSPMNAARCKRIEDRGGNSFAEFNIPRCIRDVKQGFGRLIRTRSDRGLFAILDSRMRTARYARQIADALPNFRFQSELDNCQF